MIFNGPRTLAFLHRLLVILAFVLPALLGLRPAAAAAAAPAAQSAPVFASVSVDVWPEYDRPSVLVMWNITLSPETKLPVELAVRIPKSAGQPSAVAAKDVNGMFNLQYDTAVDGDWLKVSFMASTSELRIEYYDTSLSKTGQARAYTFRWPGDYAVNSLIVHVQQPGNATGMTFTPALSGGAQGNDGLTYYSLDAGKVGAGQTVDLKVAYSKPDDALTNPESFEPVTPVQPVTEQTSGRVSLNDKLPWAIGGLGILLIGVGAFWYWRTGRSEAPLPASGRRHASSRSAGAETPGKEPADRGEAIYCHQCGKRAGPGDAFCRTCGTKLKI